MDATLSPNAGEVQVGSPSAYPVLDAFEGTIKRPKVSIFYQLGLAIVAVAMILLPLIYLALVAAAGYGVYYYGAHISGPLMSTRMGSSGRVFLFKIFLAVAPLIIGVIMVFFLVKPLFAGRAPRAQPYALNPGAEPLLYAFIEKICWLVGAPFPKRIDLDCNLNAAAGFRRGLLSLFGNDLVLTIGLPLVAGLNMGQFAGLLAHEFGHFTQGLGMRLTYVIRSVDGWFARVVFERDAWDLRLAEWAESEDWRVAVVMALARLGVWMSRLVLHLLMLIGHGISCFMLRQMEYDADAYEIKVAGSEAFESTVRRIAVMAAALGAIYKDMRVTWNMNRRLPDNLSAYLLTKLEDLPEAVKEKIDNELGLVRTGLFDTHPSDADRIRQARVANDPGIFQVTDPAAALFENFDVPAKFVTLIHYQDDLYLPVDESSLVAAKRPERAEADPEPVALPQVQEDSSTVLSRYFFGLAPLLRPIRLTLEEVKASMEVKAVIERFQSLPVRMNMVLPQVQAVAQQYAQAEERELLIYQGLNLLQAGFRIDPGAFQIPEAAEPAAKEALAQAQAGQKVIHKKLREVLEELLVRLRGTLGLLWSPLVASKVPEAEALRLLPRLGDIHRPVLNLRRESYALAILLAQPSHASPQLDAAIASAVTRAIEQIEGIKEHTTNLHYRFSPGQEPSSVNEYSAFPQYDPKDPASVAQEAATRVQRLQGLHDELAAGLVRIAEAIERTL